MARAAARHPAPAPRRGRPDLAPAASAVAVRVHETAHNGNSSQIPSCLLRVNLHLAENIRDAIEQEMVEAVDFALGSPMPDQDALYSDVYVSYSNPIPGLR